MKTSQPSPATICRLILEFCKWLGGTHGGMKSVRSHLIVSGERAFKIEDNA